MKQPHTANIPIRDRNVNKCYLFFSRTLYNRKPICFQVHATKVFCTINTLRIGHKIQTIAFHRSHVNKYSEAIDMLYKSKKFHELITKNRDEPKGTNLQNGSVTIGCAIIR
jgi:hypothetical protein